VIPREVKAIIKVGDKRLIFREPQFEFLGQEGFDFGLDFFRPD